MERKISDLEQKIAAGDTSADTLDQYQAAQTGLEAAMTEWETSQQKLDLMLNVEC